MSQQAMMLIPLLGMVMLTVAVSFILIKMRYRAVLKDGLHPAYFKLNRGAKLPDYLVRATQHYDNLFETPILYYVAILLLISLNISDFVYIALSWTYLLIRIMHTYIHITHNTLRQRRNVFLLSYCVLIILWGRIAFEVIRL